MSESVYNQALGKKFAKSYERLAELELQGLEIECEGMSLMVGLTVDSLRVALEAEAELSASRAVEGTTKTGNPDLLRGKEWVTFKTASRYLGRTRRAVQIAVKKGTLIAKGRAPNRLITVESLQKYLPS